MTSVVMVSLMGRSSSHTDTLYDYEPFLPFPRGYSDHVLLGGGQFFMVSIFVHFGMELFLPQIDKTHKNVWDNKAYPLITKMCFLIISSNDT